MAKSIILAFLSFFLFFSVSSHFPVDSNLCSELASQNEAIKTSNGNFYKTLKFIGQGSYSVVCLAIQTNESNEEIQKVAIKFIRVNSDTTRYREILNYASHEFSILKKVENSALFVKTIEMVEIFLGESKTLLIINEFCDSELRTYLKSNPEKLLHSLIQIAEAFSVLKSKGIGHFDIKPDNLLVKAGQVKVIDFGLAEKVWNFSKNKDLRYAENYRPPEMKKTLRLTYEMEVFALGMTFLNLICDRLGFEVIGLRSRLDANRHELFSELYERTNVDGVTRFLITVVDKWMVREIPSERIEIKELFGLLNNLADDSSK